MYARALLSALGKRDDIDVRVIKAPRAGVVATGRWMAYGASRRIRKIGASILHAPAYLAPWNAGVPLVLTIHDLSVGRMPTGHPVEWRMYNRLMLPRLARGATTIITPTETTRQDVIHTLGVTPERVVATPYGVDERFFGQGRRDRSAAPAAPVIVFPGPPIGRKNLDIVLRALATAPAGSALSAARLEITGALAEDFPGYQKTVLETGLRERVTWLGTLPFENMPAVYARADLLAYPSFVEGFGFPPLEAMAAGTPVVASDASCLPEVLGDAALLVDPSDATAFASAVESVLDKPDLRSRMVSAGTARAKSFTWAKCAAETAAVYTMAARGRSTAEIR